MTTVVVSDARSEPTSAEEGVPAGTARCSLEEPAPPVQAREKEAGKSRPGLGALVFAALLVVIWWPLGHLATGLKIYLSIGSFPLACLIGEPRNSTWAEMTAILGLCYVLWWPLGEWPLWLKILLTVVVVVGVCVGAGQRQPGKK
jgi:hypothetical protein